MTPKPNCAAPNCPREATHKGLCYAHYRRQYRGRPIDSPIGMRGVVDITGTRVPEEVAHLLETTAQAQNITVYELVRRIMMDWYDRAAPRPQQARRAT